MTTPLFDIWIESDYTDKLRISVSEGGPDKPHNPDNALATAEIERRDDFPADTIHRHNTGAPASMVRFAMLPDRVRNDALDTLARAYIALQENGHDFTTCE